ncbi:MAG: LPS export ABC transporter permease LptG [Rhodocyclaceae bacterium]|nr:LPS export ABC transporter permease LptG [Rhodocyclaceae bacterium]
MKIFERHLAREIYGATLLVLAAFLMLFSFFDLIYEFESIGKGGYQLQHALLYVLLLVPGRAYELFPVAVLIGSLYALTQLARHSEITVLRTSGAATPAFLRALVKIGIPFVLATFLIGEVLAPVAEKTAQQVRLTAMSQLVAQEFRTGLWVKDDKAFVNIRETTSEGGLRGVRIYQFDQNFELQTISEAESGEFRAPDIWALRNVARTTLRGDGASIEHLPDLSWQSSLNPDILSVLMVNPERMSIDRLYRYIEHLSANQQKTDRYEIALWKKLIYPLACLVMMALALPFAYLQDRMGAVGIKVFAGIMLGVIFNMLNGLFSSLGMLNDWAPFVSAITPSALFVLTASVMLWWSERR